MHNYFLFTVLSLFRFITKLVMVVVIIWVGLGYLDVVPAVMW